MIDSQPPSLTDFVDVATLQSLQERFCALTEVAISIRRPDGTPITATSGENEFCRLMQASPGSAEACSRSHAEAAALVGVGDRPCQRQCHAGLTQFAAPITVQGRHLGTILIGDRPRTPPTEDGTRTLALQYGLDDDALLRAAWSLRNWSDRDMQAAVDFLQLMANALAQRCFQEAELRDRVAELSVLYRLTAMLAGTADVQDILNKSTGLAAEVLEVKASSIRLLDEDTGELKIAAVHNLSRRYLDKGTILVQNSPIDAEAMEKGVVYIANQPQDPRTLYPDEAREEGIVSALIAPMTYRGKAIGVMRVYSARPRVFSPFEQSLLQSMASQMAAAIQDARLRHDAQDADRLEREIAMAADVQRRMIPTIPPRHPKLQFGAVYSPSLVLSGDFYDFLELPKGNVGVAVADVVGKGVPASLMMASVRAALRAHAKSIYDIDRIMSEVNRDLCRDTLISEFVTAFYGVFAPDGRRLTYCNAGHEPPMLLRDGAIQRLEAGGLILGIDPMAKYERGIIDLQSGDVLLFCTDGLVEGLNFHDEAYGRPRLEASMRAHAGLDAPNLANQVLWDLRRFRGLAEKSDDVTIVTAKVA